MTINIPISDLSNYVHKIVKEELREFKLAISDEIDDLKSNVVQLQDDLKDITDISDDIEKKTIEFYEAKDELSALVTDICNVIVSKIK